MAHAVYFDGLLARRRPVNVAIDADALSLIENGSTILSWPLADLRELESLAGQAKLRSVSSPDLANLVISDANIINVLREKLPIIPADHVRLRTPVWKIIGLSMAAAASVLGVIVVAIPMMAELLAGLVPPSIERRLGQQVAGQVRQFFSADVCQAPAGKRALQQLSVVLTRQSDLRHPVVIDVLDTPVPNAIALPGGQVFLFRGLLDKANNVDEIAGVLGHEIGHEAARDGLKGVFRSSGTAFLLSILFGDVTGSWVVILVTRQLIDSAHSRDAESQADGYGQSLMHGLGRPAARMAELLVRISGEEGKKGNIFASHPMSKDRLARLQDADASSANPLTGAPILTDEEWTALKQICSRD